MRYFSSYYSYGKNGYIGIFFTRILHIFTFQYLQNRIILSHFISSPYEKYFFVTQYFTSRPFCGKVYAWFVVGVKQKLEPEFNFIAISQPMASVIQFALAPRFSRNTLCLLSERLKFNDINS